MHYLFECRPFTLLLINAGYKHGRADSNGCNFSSMEMNMKKLMIVLLIGATTGCTTNTHEHSAGDLREALIGEWRNIYMKVVMSTYQNTPDLEKTMEADSTNWEESLRMKPIRTFFKADSTYHSDYYNLHDSLMFSISGKWRIAGDTLVMNQEKPGVHTYKLHTAVKSNVAKFTGVLDFDEDGKADDHYFGMQRRQ